jgi:chemosensory pili system protein ChpA (sensor histidine kinase/response regulator)
MQEAAQDLDLATNDLGPLAWVLDELRKSLESASAALRRFVRDTGLARGSDMASVDAGQLRIARQQLHQAVGALEMVGLGAPAHMLRSMEAAVQTFIERPELCNDASAGKVERAGFALTEYLEAVLLGKPVSAVALFPQYRDTQELAGADRIHPADLWPMEWRWNDPQTPAVTEALMYDPAVRKRMDQGALRLMKSGDSAAARELAKVCLGLAATQSARQPKIFWKICAGFFEAVASGLLPQDVYVKRAVSRVLQQYTSLAKGELGVSDRLAQDLVFFCSQAAPPNNADAPALAGVRLAWSLGRFAPVDYQTAQYGRFDPVLLAQARKRIGFAKETWSSLSGGDASKLKGLADQFHTVTDSLVKLHPPSAPLAQSLAGVIEAVVRSGRAPAPELAMEVATAVLYLEAAFAELDPSDSQLVVRTSRLAERLDTARKGGKPEVLEPWMEELYRRVSDRQTMGSVVGELRGTLGELEKLLDQFFRNIQDKTPLRDAPGHLSQMRGVLSVLGLEQAAQAVLRMRESVEEIIVTEIDEERARAAGTFDKLGNNLGALGFLIDMLNYQPTLAKKLFVYDDGTGELRPLMGRTGHGAALGEPADEEQSAAEGAGAGGSIELDAIALDAPAAPATQSEVKAPPEAAAAPSPNFDATAVIAAAAPVATKSAAPTAPPVAAPSDIEEDDLLDIFLEEAREVVGNGLVAINALAENPADISELTTLRRAFHTLKGSSRMVGLTDFGEAAWSLEQVLNTCLADQKPANENLRTLASQAMRGFALWVDDIAAHQDGAWKATLFRGPADTFRTENRLVALVLPERAQKTEPVAAQPQATEIAFLEPEQGDAAKADLASSAPIDEISFHTTAQAAPELPTESVPEIPAEPPSDYVAAFGTTQTFHLEPDDIEPPQPDELAPDFVFDLSPAAQPEPQPEPEVRRAAAQEPVEIEGIDFASLSELSDAQAGLPPELEAEAADEADDQVKVIGSLRIGIPLYNVYLNEADEWSRRLANELTEWALELHQRVPDSVVGLAHALGGSSATVGFHALSDIARALESSLQQAQTLAYATPQHASVFTQAADEIRRLLHQFAAGFLKECDRNLIDALHALRSLDLPKRADMPEDEFSGEFAADAGAGDSVFPTETPEQAAVPSAQPDAAAPAAAPTLFAPSVTVPAAPVRPAVDFAAEQDEIDAVDAIDPDLFTIFEEEAAELMPQLGGALRQWNARPDNRSARDEVLRALHTLKGSARLAGALRLGELAHRLESHVEHLGSESVAAADVEPLLNYFDGMQGTFDALRASGGAQPAAFADEPSLEPASNAIVSADAMSAAPSITPVSPARALIAQPVVSNLAPQRAAANQAVRVRSQLLDRMVNQAGEVMITRSRLEAELRQLRGSLSDLTGNLDRLRAQLRDIELQAESQMQSRLAQAKDSAAGFDPLEFDRFTRVQELTRMMAESVNDVATVQRNLQRTVESTEDDLIAQARQTRELQRDLLRTRMVEFEGISDRLYRVIRLASKESGKQVKLDITGGSIEMDRGVLDRMTPAFEHLLRNCVAHGIELPQARAAAGKDPVGSIIIGLHHEGNDVSIEFHDDGAGLDLQRIREKALQQGLISPGQSLSEPEAASLIFMPGFSTATEVTELSGRGIGMDVVRAEVNAVGGRIETRTEAGRGAHFKLVLPLTTAVTQVVMIRSGSLSIGVPANLIEIVRRAPAKDVQQAYNSGTYEFGGEQLPFFWSGALLQASQRSTEPQAKTMPVVVFRSAAQRIAVHVDEVLGNQEVVVKNLGPQLARLPGLAGMTVLASGAVVLIYNPVALTTVYGEQARQLSADQAQPDVLGQNLTPVPDLPAPPQIPLVLVVDDSITVRRVTQRLLQREGYRVALAADGLQALERLAEERPAVVLSDIEMPRMDGFDLARNIRADAKLKQLPIIMITSRIAEKHREHAKELGVDHYLGKPYAEEELLSLVRHYASAAALA